LLAKHIKRVKKAYSQRRDAMLESLEKHFPDEAKWNRPEGGMSVWIRLPDTLNSKQLLLQAVENGVTFISGDHFYASSSQQNMMRLSFTMAGPQAIEEAVKRLGNIMKARMVKMKRQRATGRTDGLRALV